MWIKNEFNNVLGQAYLSIEFMMDMLESFFVFHYIILVLSDIGSV